MKVPVALFVYNRPEHTKRTLEALAKNNLADKTELFIFADGPKNKEDHFKISQIKKIVLNQNGFKSIKMISRSSNYGLAKNIILGLNEILLNYTKVIVLEDDILTSREFLTYMNHFLNFYENQSEVMHISGHMYNIDVSGLEDTFFLQLGTCWGWGTWSRAWEKFNKNYSLLSDDFKNLKFKFNLDNSYKFTNQLELNQKGKMNTWAVFWYQSIFLNNGLSLHPKVTLTQNIGFDNSGDNCTQSNFFTASELSKLSSWESPIILEENMMARAKVIEFFKEANSIYNLIKRVWNVLKKISKKKSKLV